MTYEIRLNRCEDKDVTFKFYDGEENPIDLTGSTFDFHIHGRVTHETLIPVGGDAVNEVVVSFPHSLHIQDDHAKFELFRVDTNDEVVRRSLLISGNMTVSGCLV